VINTQCGDGLLKQENVSCTWTSSWLSRKTPVCCKVYFKSQYTLCVCTIVRTVLVLKSASRAKLLLFASLVLYRMLMIVPSLIQIVTQTQIIYTDGCYDKFEELIKDLLPVLGGVMIGIIALEVM